MRKQLAVLASLVLILAAVSGPAAGAKPKKESGSFDVVALPYPNGSYDDGAGCYYGVEPIHRVSTELESPFTGTLDVDMALEVGDWDLFIENAKGEVITESSGSDATPEHTTNKVKKGEVITVVACNWAGEPQVTIDYEFTSR